MIWITVLKRLQAVEANEITTGMKSNNATTTKMEE